jgi:hypothetical protein
MSEPILMMSRRLAIQMLHEAQIAQPDSITGVVVARNAQPVSFHQGKQVSADQTLWARCWSNPLAPAIPTAEELAAGGLHLVISLNTKGVLEMRAWELKAGQPHEREIKIKD